MAHRSFNHHPHVMAGRCRGFVCGEERVEGRGEGEGEGSLSDKLTGAYTHISAVSSTSRDRPLCEIAVLSSHSGKTGSIPNKWLCLNETGERPWGKDAEV
jgi:hypothetical protein